MEQGPLHGAEEPWHPLDIKDMNELIGSPGSVARPKRLVGHRSQSRLVRWDSGSCDPVPSAVFVPRAFAIHAPAAGVRGQAAAPVGSPG